MDALTDADVLAVRRLARGAAKAWLMAALPMLLPIWLLPWGQDDTDVLAFRSGTQALAGLSDVLVANTARVHGVEIPSVNGLANARALAKLGMAAVAAGGGDAPRRAGGGGADVTKPLLSRGGLRRALATAGRRVDELMCYGISYTACGWGADRFEPDGLPGWVGWAGAGGSVVQFDAARQASFAYVPTRLAARMSKPRAVRCLRALHAVLGNLTA